MSRFALGLDFGTESVRALVVDGRNGDEAAEAVAPYAHGVITESLPGRTERLPPDFALQHPDDYLHGARDAIREVLKTVRAADLAGVGVDFTACTILPIRRDGTPLMRLPEFADHPHAWVKLWKHHGAQFEADRINAVARLRNEAFLKYYGGSVSSEWMLPKCWEIARNAPHIYQAANLLIDAGDWIVMQMTGIASRNACAAGYKGLWNAELGFPSKEFLAAVDPVIRDVDEKWLKNVVAPGTRVGGVTPEWAALTGLREGTPVSAATIDAHSGVAGMGVADEGVMSIIMGTSSCHMVLSKELKLFEGYAGVVKDGILPGFYGYESGQSAVGDIFHWFARTFLGSRAADPFAALSRKAAKLKPGQSGLVSLDWMNGNRSVLMNAHLSGVIMGATLATRPEEVYRALIEGTAFGTRRIMDAYRSNGIGLRELVVCGGLTGDPLIMQTYADVTGLPVRVAASRQAVALGAAILGAVAGGQGSVSETVAAMTKPPTKTYAPRPEAVDVYNQLFPLYEQCHDWWGREKPDVMRQLKAIRGKTLGG
jgi:L-ribulokinase